MKTVFTFLLTLSAVFSLQARQPVQNELLTVNAPLQSGFLKYNRTITVHEASPVWQENRLVTVYFILNEKGGYDYAYEDQQSICLSRGGRELYFKSILGGYTQTKEFESPIKRTGILSYWLNPETSVNSTSDAEISDKLPENISVTDTDGKITTTIKEEVIEKILNKYDQKAFDDLFIAIMAKAVIPFNVYNEDVTPMPKNLLIYDLAGEQYISNENSYKLFVYVPDVYKLTPSLLEFVSGIQNRFKETLNIVCLTDNQKVMEAASSSLRMPFYSGDPKALENTFHDDEVRFLLVNKQDYIRRVFVGHHPEQEARISRYLEEYIK